MVGIGPFKKTRNFEKYFKTFFFELIKGAAESCEGQKWPKRTKEFAKNRQKTFLASLQRFLLDQIPKRAEFFLKGCKI